jgi:hypothetical protein
MTDEKIDIKRWFHFTLRIIPLVALVGSIAAWVDIRYMHNETFEHYTQMTDMRNIEMQIKIVEGHIRDYTRILEMGGTLSHSEQIYYELEQKQLADLISERNKLLGMGGME